MKCKKNAGDCKLEIKLLENGDVFEFCTVCDFTNLYKSANIQNNHLNPSKKED